MKSFIMQGSRRAIAIATVAALAGLGMSACAGAAPEDTGTATSGTVNWWGESTESAVAEQYIAEFNKEYPDITVNYKKLLTDDWVAALRPALISPSGPDVYELSPGARIAAFGSFAEDLTPLVEETLGADWKDKVSPLGVDGLTIDGNLVGLSVGQVYSGSLWINPGLFEKYDVAVPTTLDEWEAACAKFQANGQGCFVHGAAVEAFNQDLLQAIADNIEPGVWTAASRGDTEWNDPVIVKTFEIWKELFDRGIMQPGAIGYSQYPDANNDFITGKYAMIMMGTWYMGNAPTTFLKAALEGAGVVDGELIPMVPVDFPDVSGSGNPPAYFGDADIGLAVSKKAANKAASETFVSWLALTTNGQQQVANALSQIPALKGVPTQWDSIEMVDQATQEAPIQAFVAKASESSEPRMALLTKDVQDAILTASTGVADGTLTPEDAAAGIQAAAG